MALLTTPDNIATPASGQNYALTTDLAATAGTVQTALTQKANYGVGTTTERTAALGKFPNGAQWYDTTLSAEYRRVAGVWVASSSGAYNYVWANAAARTAQTGMIAGQKGYQTDTDVEYKYNGTIWIPKNANVAYRIAIPVNVATAAETTLDLDASPTALLGAFTEAAGVVTMPYDGQVLITAQAIIGAASGSPTLYQLRVFKNGTANNILSVYQAPAVARVLNGTGMIRVAAGDTLRVRAYQNSGATQTVGEINSDSPILILQYIN